MGGGDGVGDHITMCNIPARYLKQISATRASFRFLVMLVAKLV